MMAPKDRVELRLSERLLQQIDEWQSTQNEASTRSDAVRLLIEKGLQAASTASIDERLFQQMRFAILSAAKAEICEYADHYLYAWQACVYPIMDEHLSMQEGFDSSFKVSKKMCEELLAYLEKCRRRGEGATFYELEDYFDVRQGTTHWDRVNLMFACEYFWLSGRADHLVSNLLKPMQHPTEATSISQPFKLDF